MAVLLIIVAVIAIVPAGLAPEAGELMELFSVCFGLVPRWLFELCRNLPWRTASSLRTLHA